MLGQFSNWNQDNFLILSRRHIALHCLHHGTNFPGGPEIILDEIIYYTVYSIQYYIHCTGGRNQDHPQEKEMQKGKTVV